MVNPRSAVGPSMASASTSSINTTYSLALLAEYTHTLDTIPIDLSRSFADLRELDAVLSSSMIAITAKIRSLTQMIEENRATREERLWLLHEIAEEAARLKFGSDDKIRVAYQAADMLKDHSSHLHTLADHLPDFDANVLNRRTVYPHVSAKSFMPLNMDTGRRRRGGAGQNGFMIGNSASEPSPAKRKRVARDEDIDIGNIRSPHKKERIPEQPASARSRVNNKVKKNERVPSPSESLVSVTSHLPSQNTHHANGTSNNTRGGSSSYHPNQSSGLATSGRTQSGTGTTTNKRSRGGNANNANRVSTTPQYSAPNSSSLPSHRTGSGIPASSSHNHLSGTYANGNGVIPTNGASHQYEYTQHSVSNTPDWNTPPTQLEGPGMPVAKSTSISSNVAGNGRNAHANSNVSNGNLNAANADGATEGGDADGDNDDGRTYCYCDGFSFGEMIACDDENCEREWFHLSCIGLTICPEGAWYCNTCKTRRNAKRSGRGGKRRAGNGRAGGKA